MFATLLVRNATLCCALLFPLTMLHAQCNFIRADSPNADTVIFTFGGGGFASFGCAPIDPTYWISGSGMSATATFVVPATDPAIRVWGMNSDDIASVAVNGLAYPLNSTTAHYDPKVVCGLSPGPDGVVFVTGNVTGANSPADGNFSYQDVFIDAIGVTSITITGIAGAGWGFVGVSVDCDSGEPGYIQGLGMGHEAMYPNPTSGLVYFPDNGGGLSMVEIINGQGAVMKVLHGVVGSVDLRDLPTGMYSVMIEADHQRRVQRILKL